MQEIIIILLIIIYAQGKLFTMDIYDTLDYECRLICDSMRAQTKISLLRDLHDKGVHMILKNYSGQVETELVNDYVSIIKETYNLCRTILTNQNISTVSLN